MSEILKTAEVELRVRYNETDAMGYLHHSNYLVYFEIGRTDLFRKQGGSYRVMEELGMFFVVAKVSVQYKAPARYDDVLTLTTTIARQTPAKLIHEYELRRGTNVICTAQTTIACVDRQGHVQRIPDDLNVLTSDANSDQ